MKRASVSGLILAVVGLILFAHQGIAQATQKHEASEQTIARHARSAATIEEGFPVASLLAGFFFISGIGLVAIAAHPLEPARDDEPIS